MKFKSAPPGLVRSVAKALIYADPIGGIFTRTQQFDERTAEACLKLQASLQVGVDSMTGDNPYDLVIMLFCLGIVEDNQDPVQRDFALVGRD